MKNSIILICTIIAIVMINVSVWGMTYGDYDISFVGDVSETYDDNITYAKDDKKNDLITGLKGGVKIEKLGKTTNVEVDANIIQELFASNSKFNNLSEDIQAHFYTELTKYDRITLSNSFLHAEEPRNYISASGDERGRYEYYTNNFDIGYERELSKQFSFGLGYTNGLNIPAEEGFRNSYFNRAGANITYFHSTETIFSASYNIIRRDIEDGDNSLRNSVALGLRQYFTDQIYCDASAGLDYINTFDDETETAPNLKFSITDELSETSKATLAIEKTYHDTEYDERMSDYWQISGSYNIQPLKRLELATSIFYSLSDYLNIDIEENYFGVRIASTYEISESILFDLKYAYSQKNSDFTSGDYDKNVITAGIRCIF